VASETGPPTADAVEVDAVEVDAVEAGEAAPGGAAAVPAEPVDPVQQQLRRLRVLAAVGFGLAALGLVLSVVLGLQASALRAREADRQAVLDAAEVMALRITTFEGATIDRWVTDTQSLATGEYAQEVAGLFDPTVRQGLRDNQVQSVGEITSSFVQDLDEDEATAFLVLRQTFVSASQPTPLSDELRMELELQRVDGRWLTSDAAVLGPSTVAPIPTAEPTTAPPTPTQETEQG
jgi:Mce-associated membrane protein